MAETNVQRATVNGLSIAYEVFGEGRPWIITPGGRFSKDYKGVRELAVALAERGNRVVIYDRPNCGESEVCFTGDSESEMQADTLAALLRELDMTPAVISGGSGGSRISLLAATRHRDVARGIAIWWITGGVYGLMSLASYYCAPSVPAAWNGGMEAVMELPSWEEPLRRYPPNRDRFLAQDPKEFIAVMERWMKVYCACPGERVPGLPDDDVRGLDIPALVFRSGASDPDHPRKQSEDVAAMLPQSELVEPPWPDTEWIDRRRGIWQEFERWPLLAPPLADWADKHFG
jgi:pimeloyl-ACP methyl ester carboxylesterase